MTLLLLRGANMRVMHLSSKLQTRQRLVEMILHWRNHHKHERFRVTTKGILEEIRQLSQHIRIVSCHGMDEMT